jgi:hypothetical protein
MLDRPSKKKGQVCSRLGKITIPCILAFQPTRKDLKKHLCIARTVCSSSTKALFIFEVGGNVTVVFSLPFIHGLSTIQLS